MKFKIASGGFISHICIMLPITLIFIGIVSYAVIFKKAHSDVLLLVVLFIPYFFFLFIRRKDIFSIVTMASSGISVSFLGNVWFAAHWDELNCIGRFQRTVILGRPGLEWIYFSKEPVQIKKS